MLYIFPNYLLLPPVSLPSQFWHSVAGAAVQFATPMPHLKYLCCSCWRSRPSNGGPPAKWQLAGTCSNRRRCRCLQISVYPPLFPREQDSSRRLMTTSQTAAPAAVVAPSCRCPSRCWTSLHTSLQNLPMSLLLQLQPVKLPMTRVPRIADSHQSKLSISKRSRCRMTSPNGRCQSSSPT